MRYNKNNKFYNHKNHQQFCIIIIFSLFLICSTITNAHGNHHNDNHSSGNNTTNCSSLERCSYNEKDGGRERISSSHYSTEKSGSSGYYSSNVYSTSSVEDHIYSEPVIDVIDTKTKRTIENRRKFEKKMDQKNGLANLEKSIKNLEKHLKLLNRHQQHSCEMCVVNSNNGTEIGCDGEKIKRLPTIVEGVDASGNGSCSGINGSNNTGVQKFHLHGDNQIVPNNWPVVDADDSLLDLDFDSFLLVNEMRDKKKTMDNNGVENPTYETDNEDENVDNVLRNNDKANDDDVNHENIPVTNCDKHIENNYKCTKYINSCPDDAYNVEGVNDYKYAPHSPSTDKSLSFYLKNSEDRVHYQNTKDILEEIREKLTMLLTPTDNSLNGSTTKIIKSSTFSENGTDESDTGHSSAQDDVKSETDSLKQNILTLKHDLERYLKLMNQQNEMEIKQFCTGLSKNYKLLTIQHALENKARSKASVSDNSSELYSSRSYCSSSRGTTDSSSHDISLYTENGLAPSSDILYVRDGFNYEPNQLRKNDTQKFRIGTADSNDSIRCSSGSDSNFHLQRRASDSISSSWDDGQQQIITTSSDVTSGSSSNGGGGGGDLILQVTKQQVEQSLQQQSHIGNNLAMQQPSLITSNKNGADDEKDLMLDWHRNKPSIWQQYYGSKRLKYSNVVKKIKGKFEINPTMTYVSFHFIYFYFFFY